MMFPLVPLMGFFIAYFLSILFVSADTALGSISRDSLEKLAENRVRGAMLVMGINANRRRFQLMLLAGRILSIIAGTVFLYTLLEPLTGPSGGSPFITGMTTCVLGAVLFLGAEGFLARMLAFGEYEKTVSRFAYFILISHLVLFPVTYFIDRMLSLVIKKNIELAAKEEALIEFVRSESEAGVIEEEERDMIESILEFSDTTVREVMVPRIDVIAAENTITLDELITLFQEEGHSRIPIYKERIDNIVGFIYAKDLLTALARKERNNIALDEILREPYFVPETKMLSVLLREFKAAKVHIAVVVDEYGGTAGIVALEDLLEEIVGEIQDEYDEEEQESSWLDDVTVLLDAGLDIDDVNEIIHTDIPDEDFDTLGGFLYHQLGFIPQGGETVQWEGVTFTVKEIDGNRISTVTASLEKPLMMNDKSDDE